jgi:hypothetical protein
MRCRCWMTRAFANKAALGVDCYDSGTLGKVENCQIAVTCCYTDPQANWPVTVCLYLSQARADDPDCRRKPAYRRGAQRAPVRGLSGKVRTFSNSLSHLHPRRLIHLVFCLPVPPRAIYSTSHACPLPGPRCLMLSEASGPPMATGPARLRVTNTLLPPPAVAAAVSGFAR